MWSCQFNPLNFGLVATTSEDQTCKTWSLAANSASFSPLQEVSKHQLAATCVDWQVMKPGLGSVVACCSDDKLARAFRFSPEDQQCTLLAEVDFSFLHEFFTLTYLALEKVVCDHAGRLAARDREPDRPPVPLRPREERAGLLRESALGRSRGPGDPRANRLHLQLGQHGHDLEVRRPGQNRAALPAVDRPPDGREALGLCERELP